jgi:hypothetical protein
MEEAGILGNTTLLNVVIPTFEPGLKNGRNGSFEDTSRPTPPGLVQKISRNGLER